MVYGKGDQGWFEGKRNIWMSFGRKKFLMILFVPVHFLIIALSGEPQSVFKKHVLDAWKMIRSQKEDQPVIVVAHSGVFTDDIDA